MILKTTLRTSSVLTAVDIIIESDPKRMEPPSSYLFGTVSTCSVLIVCGKNLQFDLHWSRAMSAKKPQNSHAISQYYTT